ncbi:hypothetical protein DMB42_47920 [Nonomuraea sp. WAC 01424]|uniref:MmyB family transcriptional regulator n=1 Tax=Nonomuraea sp. WAC 01424 TaxID=2203200 RepID=UPI000F7A5F06|nr:hypothetical protein [Nonomuraea sp. WAC 01424]RSM96599.1 hypothetical protein DMB42_47920 [Nonomuraea sp. WAC 01424]
MSFFTNARFRSSLSHWEDAAEGVKVVHTPETGEPIFEYRSLSLPDRPGHRLMLHTPQPGTATGARLSELMASA